MYETLVINSSKKNCNCSVKKIDLKSQCGTPEYFLVTNYFSELVHEWEKEAARYNLGVQELEGIEYVTEATEDGEMLTKVIFRYRKGHEIITREFCCAPKGDKGDKGDTGIQGPQGEKGDCPALNKVILHWVDNCTEEHGEFTETSVANRYNLDLYLRQPNTFDELSRILDEINNTLASNYVTRSLLNEILSQYSKIDYSLSDLNLIYNENRKSLLLRYKNLNLGDVIYLDIPEYTLSTNNTNRSLNLLKDGQIQSSVSFDSISGLKGDTVEIYYVAYTNATPPAPGQIGAPAWSTSVPTVTENYPYIWIAIRRNEGLWNVVRLTGSSGKNGTDGSSGTDTAIDYDGIDFVFVNTKEMLTSNTIQTLTSLINFDTDYQTRNYTESGKNYVISDKTYKVTGNASGITESKPYEYIGIRIKSDSKFVLETLTLWSIWGKSGRDGAYVEYIYGGFKSKPTWNNSDLNPLSWINNHSEDFLEPDYKGPMNLGNNINLGHWFDNPIDPTSTYKYVYCSSRKYDGENFSEFSQPAIWSMWVDVEKGNSDIILTGDLPVITYDISLSNIEDIPHTLHLTAYNGNSKLNILTYQYEGESAAEYESTGIDISSLLLANIQNVSLRSPGTYKHTFTVEIELPESLQTEENVSTYRTYTIIETAIANVASGADGVNYKLLVTPSAITFNDNDELTTSNITFRVLKNGSEINYSSDNTWKVTIGASISQITLISDKNTPRTTYSISSLRVPLNTLTNGVYFTLNLRINNVLWDLVRIPVLKNSQHAVSPYIVRNRGEWKSNVDYKGISQTVASGEIKYVDVVYTAETNLALERTETYWMCKVDNQGVAPVENSTVWEKISSVSYAYIKTLISDVIDTLSLLAKEVLIKNANNEIVAGMTSGSRINNSNDDGKSVRIWAGTGTVYDANDLIKSSDLTNAPFKVYENGSMVANNATITGNVTLTNLILANSNSTNVSYYENPSVINLGPENNHRIIYVFTGQNTTLVNAIDTTLVYSINNAIRSTTESLELEQNKVYLIVKTQIGWRIVVLEAINVARDGLQQLTGWLSLSSEHKTSQQNGSFNVDGCFEISVYDDISRFADSLISGYTNATWTNNFKYDIEEEFCVDLRKSSWNQDVYVTYPIFVEAKNIFTDASQVHGTITVYLQGFSDPDNLLEYDLYRIYNPNTLDPEEWTNSLDMSADLFDGLDNILLSLIKVYREYTYTSTEQRTGMVLNNNTIVDSVTHEILGEVSGQSVYNISGKAFEMNYNNTRYIVADGTEAQPFSSMVIDGGELQPNN